MVLVLITAGLYETSFKTLRLGLKMLWDCIVYYQIGSLPARLPGFKTEDVAGRGQEFQAEEGISRLKSLDVAISRLSLKRCSV